MIVATHDQGLWIVTQNDHAHLAAEILSLWRRDGLPGHPRRDVLLRATREHDNGWREADSAPRHNPEDGRPHDFRSLPDEERRELWHRGVGRFLDSDPEMALLVVRHARQLHRGHRGEPGWDPLLDRWWQLEEELLEWTGQDRETLEGDYRWLELADHLSLTLSCRWRKEIERHGYRVEGRGDLLAFDPFPLAGATTFRLPCRTIPDRRYAGDADLGVELAAARWEDRAVRLVPWDAR